MKKKTILVVEDEAPLRKALVEVLTNDGLEVLQGGNGIEGLRIAQEQSPDLILLDIVMPEMDGLTMMQKLRAASEYGRKVPIILLTNLSADDDRIMAAIVKHEPSYFLVKSNWKIADVVAKVRERLAKSSEI